MGKKKPNEQETNSITQNDVDSAAPPPSPNAFYSLFGDIQAKNDAVLSLFSDNNPFKRKPLQQPAETIIIDDGDAEKSEIKEKKFREKTNFDDPNSIQEEEFTLIKKKSKKADMGFEGKSETETPKTPILDFEGKIKLGNESLRNAKNSIFDGLNKKRKRDDVEREYEVRMYGVNDEEERKSNVVGMKRKKADDTADMMVSKEGFDDESKLLRTVFVGNLPVKVKKKLLIKEFRKFGEIESVGIRSVPLMDTKKPAKGAIMLKQINVNADSVHAYIVFKTEQSAESSLSHNMAVVGGHHIRVDRACPPRKKLKGDDSSLYDNKRTIFVGNLPYDVKDEELYQLFSGIKGLESSIEALRVVRHPRIGVEKGFAYVLFKTTEAANLATRKLNLKLRDRELRLSHAKQDSTPSKRKSSQNTSIDASPSKKSARDFTPVSDSKNKSTSYQGLRANKSNNNYQRKFRATSNVIAQTEGTPKVRMSKRLAVAARRAADDAGGSKQHAGVKRKLSSRTPESSHRHKKVKKFR